MPDRPAHRAADPFAVPTDPPSQTIFVGPHDLAALYVDGAIALVATEFEVNARALEIAGITRTESAAFLRGFDLDTLDEHTPLRDVAAPTLSAITEFTDLSTRATDLRAQAQALLDEAAAIDARLHGGDTPAAAETLDPLTADLADLDETDQPETDAETAEPISA